MNSEYMNQWYIQSTTSSWCLAQCYSLRRPRRRSPRHRFKTLRKFPVPQLQYQSVHLTSHLSPLKARSEDKYNLPRSLQVAIRASSLADGVKCHRNGQLWCESQHASEFKRTIDNTATVSPCLFRSAQQILRHLPSFPTRSVGEGLSSSEAICDRNNHSVSVAALK